MLAATTVFLCGAPPCIAQSSIPQSSVAHSRGAQSSDVELENAEISSRRAAERTAFSDQEIVDGFFKTALGAELKFAQDDRRIRKFDEPVRVFVVDGPGRDHRADPELSSVIAKVVGDIQSRVDHLDLAMAETRATANVIVILVPRRQLGTTIRARYGAAKARKIEAALHPQCLSGIGVDKTFHIKRAEVILPADASEFAFYDCAYEELLQVLGVINDDRSVPWTMFNDDVQMGFFDTYDQHLVNILYDPRIQPGMSRAEVDRLMPEVLPSVRQWVKTTSSGERVRPSELAPLHATPSCDLEAGATPTRTALTSASGATHLSLKAADVGSQL